jgi:chromosome segregation ATPase
MNEKITKPQQPDFSITPHFGVDEKLIATLRPLLEKERDLTVPREFDELKRDLSTVKGMRVKIEARRKELKSDALDFGRRVDAAARHLTTLLRDVEVPLKKLKDVEEERRQKIKDEKIRIEQERVNKINARIRSMTERAAKMWNKTIPELKEIKIKLAADDFDYQEFTPQAASARAEADKILDDMIDAARQREEARKAARLEAERLRAENERIKKEQEEARKAAQAEAERLRAEREAAEREAAEARKAARLEAERIEAEHRAEIERLQTEPDEDDLDEDDEDLDEALDTTPRLLYSCAGCASFDVDALRCDSTGQRIDEAIMTINFFPEFCPLEKSGGKK